MLLLKNKTLFDEDPLGGGAADPGVPGADANPDGDNEGVGDGQSQQGDKAAAPQSWKVLDREFSDPNEMATELERRDREFMKLQEQAAILKDPAKLEAYLTGMKGRAPEKKSSPNAPEDYEVVRSNLGKYGVATVDEVQTIVSEAVSKALEQERAVTGLMKSVEQVAAKHNGSDGYPKADPDKLSSYMADNQIRDPEKAYRIMYFDDWMAAHAKEALKAKPRAYQSERSATSSGRTPQGQSKVSFNDMDAMLKIGFDAINQSEE